MKSSLKLNSYLYFLDAKNISPLIRKLESKNLTENTPHPSDKTPLSQGSIHRERIFINNKEDRKLLSSLFLEEISVDEFCRKKKLNSENSNLVFDSIKRLRSKNKDVLPHCYNKFLSEVTKNVPICGIIQVTESKPIKILKKFCYETLDLRSGTYPKEIELLKTQVPFIWKLLNDICLYENTDFLPLDISRIMLKMLEIRKSTFSNSPQRYNEDYIDWDKTGVFIEHPLAFYPKFPLNKYPKNYVVNNQEDDDMCAKTFPSHSDFAAGIFSVGCACEKSITYGFEVMVGHESPRLLFKLLMTRKLDRKSLKGIIYDYACGAHRYFLNREPKEVQFLHFLVDGCHFQGQKKMKKANYQTGKSGHLGCSSSYNFMSYKNKEGCSNSQSREQMHSVLDKLAPSLRQMSYENFMRTLIIFFCVRNLKIMNKFQNS